MLESSLVRIDLILLFIPPNMVLKHALVLSDISI